MDVATFHLALRRFLSAYPGCRRFISDNAKTFMRAASDVKRLYNLFNDPASRAHLEHRRIEWNFICPRAPWHGGFYERLVRSVKAALRKSLGRQLVSFDQLWTIVCEIAAIINQRPISYMLDFHFLETNN